MFAMSAWAWTVLPETGQFPVHWNAQGEVNRYAGKVETLLAAPLTALFVAAILAFAPLLDQRKENLQQSSVFYLTAWVAGMMVMLLAHFYIVYAAVTGAAPDQKIMMAAVSLFFVLVGNFMAKSKSNWIAGIRTSWTLKSEHSWSVTNRFVGWCFVLTGLISLCVLWVSNPEVYYIVFFAGIISSIVLAPVVSYFAWRSDQEAKKR